MVNLLGTGWAFPITVDAHRRVAMAHGETDVEQAIRIILSTPKGQRVMRPEFGCQIHDLVFALNDPTNAGLAISYVEEALAMWEPRIEVQRVRAVNSVESTERLLIEIDYEIKATHDRRSLVFPFYIIPDESRDGADREQFYDIGGDRARRVMDRAAGANRR